MAARLLPRDSMQRSAAYSVGAGLLLVAITQLYLKTPIGIGFLGVCVGMVTALTAAGLVLIYRTQRFVNFSQAAIGGAGGTVCFNLVRFNGAPFLLAFAAGLMVATLVGLIVEFAIIKRFSKQPRLVLTVVSIALAQAIPGGAQAVLRQIMPFIFPEERTATLAELTGNFETPLPLQGFKFVIGDLALPFGFQHIFAIEASVVGLLLLAGFFRYTRAGVAVRGVAENADRATLLGISVGSLSTLVWMLAALLSGIGVIITGTLTTPAAATGGFSTSGAVFLPALAAAVLGRMRSLPVTVAAAVGISILRQAVEFTRPDDRVIVDAILFLVIAAGLVLQRRKGGRSDAGAESSWQATQEQRPVPKELLSVPGVRAARLALPALFGLFLLGFPFVASVGLISTASVVALTGIVGLSLVVLTGWAGQVSLGQMALTAIGAAAGGSMIAKTSIPFWLVLVIVPVIVAAIVMVVGLPALRIKGLFLAVTTFAFAVAVNSVVFDPKYFGWLLPAEGVDRPKLFVVDFRSEISMYFLCIAALAVALLVVVNLRRSRFGRILIASRENEANLQSFGVNLIRTKLLAFAVSGGLCGFAGVLYAVQQQSVSRQAFPVIDSVDVFIFSVLGGIGSISGVLLGALFRTVTQDVITSDFIAPLVGPGGVLFILYVAPGGLISLINQARDAGLRIVAQRRQLIVPSLFADMDPSALAARLIPLGDPIPNSGLSALPHGERYELTSEVVGLRKGLPGARPPVVDEQALAELEPAMPSALVPGSSS